MKQLIGKLLVLSLVAMPSGFIFAGNSNLVDIELETDTDLDVDIDIEGTDLDVEVCLESETDLSLNGGALGTNQKDKEECESDVPNDPGDGGDDDSDNGGDDDDDGDDGNGGDDDGDDGNGNGDGDGDNGGDDDGDNGNGGGNDNGEGDSGNGSGNGGGGGGGRTTSSGSRANDGIGGEGEVLGASSCGIFIEDYLRKGYAQNDDLAVMKMKQFLNSYMEANLSVDSVFDDATERAVMDFQMRHQHTILGPWGISAPTGIFYLTTRAAANNIMCPELALPVPAPLIDWSQNPAVHQS